MNIDIEEYKRSLAFARRQLPTTTKKEARNMVKFLMVNLEGEGIKGRDFARLHDLLRYFTAPPTNTKAKTNLQMWALLATSKDKTRHSITRAFVDDGMLVAVDGKRVHMTPTTLPDKSTVLRDGTVLTEAESENYGTFPNYRHVIPEHHTKTEYTITGTGEYKGDTTVIVEVENGVACEYNEEWFTLCIMHCPIMYVDSDRPDISVALFKGESGSQAVLMPTYRRA